MAASDMKSSKRMTLQKLRRAGAVYVVMSNVTHMPFVVCDPETADDEVLLYYREDDAKKKAQELLRDEKYLTAVVKVPQKQLLQFYTGLYPMGINSIHVNAGMESGICIELSALVMRKPPAKGKKLVENPALHLTAMYVMQESARPDEMKNKETLSEMMEELLVHYKEGTFIVGIEDEKRRPLIKMKDETVWQPVFTDMEAFRRFDPKKKLKTAVLSAEKLAEVFTPEVKGVIINPGGINVRLNIEKKETKK